MSGAMSSPKMKYRWVVRRSQNQPGEAYKVVSNMNGYTSRIVEAYDHVSDALEAHGLEAESFRTVDSFFWKVGGLYAKTYKVDGGLVTVFMYKTS